MADLLIDSNRYRYRLQKEKKAEQNDQKAGSADVSAEAEKAKQREKPKPAPREKWEERRQTKMEEQMGRCRYLLNWLQENERLRLEEQRKARSPERKKPSTEEVQKKILDMRSKLRCGGRLTSEEKMYLANNAPGELEKLRQVEQERSALKARLEKCRTREDANRAFQDACLVALGKCEGDVDLDSVFVGQLSAALKNHGDKPGEEQLRRQICQQRQRLDRKA